MKIFISCCYLKTLIKFKLILKTKKLSDITEKTPHNFFCKTELRFFKMDSFNGKSVSIKCKRGLGVFQGSIVKAEAQTITINSVFHNGNLISKNKEAEVSKNFL